MTKSEALKTAAIPERWFKMFLEFMDLWEHEFRSVKGYGIMTALSNKTGIARSAVIENYASHLIEHKLLRKLPGLGQYAPTRKGILTYNLYMERD